MTATQVLIDQLTRARALLAEADAALDDRQLVLSELLASIDAGALDGSGLSTEELQTISLALQFCVFRHMLRDAERLAQSN